MCFFGGGKRKLCKNQNCTECYEKSFASHEKAKCWSDRNTIKAREISKSSHTKYWFRCNICEHSFEIRPYSVTIQNHWCSYCTNQKLCNMNECMLCYKKSLACDKKAKFWSDKNNVTPREVFKGSNKKYWFKCDKCHHDFQMQPNSINRDTWCSYCGHQKLCNMDECKRCYEKSFASHEKSTFWSHKNQLTPREVFKNSNKKYWFNCNECNHIFKITLNHINENKWCSYCSNPPKLLCDENNCLFCYEKSFSSHKKSKFWSSKNQLTPREVFKSSNFKYWFSCDKCGYEFDARLSDIVRGRWCSMCVYKTEQKVFDYLASFSNIKIIPQFKLSTLSNRKFDFCFPEYKLIIEIDGDQHFRQVSTWTNPQITQLNDIEKMKHALHNYYCMVRFYQPDIYEDKLDWKEIIKNHLKLEQEPKIYYYSTKEEIYEEHKKLMQIHVIE